MNSDNHIVLHEQHGKNGNIAVITLNRPQLLNASSMAMTKVIRKKLLHWDADSNIKAIFVRSNSSSFCAGGDLADIYNNDANHAVEIFWHEYRLIHTIATLSTPFISMVNGYTMGGGVGLSIYASHRLCSPDLKFAMPEAKIGFFPDIGANYFLRSAPGFVGRYLALTATTINSADAIWCGFFDHIVSKDDFANVMDEICYTDFASDANAAITNVILKYKQQLDYGDLQNNYKMINAIFSEDKVASIFHKLLQLNNEWGRKTLSELQYNSPTSMVLSLLMLQRDCKSLQYALELDFNLAQAFIANPDFREGIRALIIAKDNNPAWNPIDIEDIDIHQMEQYFLLKPKKLSFDSDVFL